MLVPPNGKRPRVGLVYVRLSVCLFRIYSDVHAVALHILKVSR